MRRSPAPANLILAGFALFLLFFRLGDTPLVETTDARYVEMSREMLLSGDYAVPTLNGIRHLHKPPFVYWMGALGMRLAGVNEFGGRLLLALFGAAVLLVVYRIARAAAGLYEARLAALSLATVPLFLFGARGMNTDLFLLFFETLALGGYFLHLKRGYRRDLAAFWAGLSLAFLVKGPVALLTVGAVVLADRLLPGARLEWRPFRPALGWSLFLLVNLPWYLHVARTLPGALDYFIFDQLASRLGGKGLGHPRPFLYYLAVFPAAALPWSLFLPSAARGAARSAFPRFALLWALAPPLLFSLPRTKLPLYVLPAMPGLALLVACHLAAAVKGGRPAPRASAALVAALPLVAAAGVFWYAFRPDAAVDLRRACLVVASLLVVAFLDAAWALASRRALPVALSAALFVGLFHAGFLAGIEAFEGRVFRSARSFAAAVAGSAAGEPFTLLQHRLYFASMNFYLGAPSVHVDFERETRFETAGTGAVLLTRAELPARLPELPGRKFILTRAEWLGDLEPLLSLEVRLAQGGFALAEVVR